MCIRDRAGTDYMSQQSDFKGQVQDGWQKVEFVFNPAATGDVYFKIRNTSGVTNNINIDDIRLYPADATMKSFVYDPADNYKLKAVLDENNYATLYYYDESGNLFLVKQETEDGIKTIQESRLHVREQ